MRLTAHELASIRDCATRHFGVDAVVRLFGSRVRDDLRGGDIDLHVVANPPGMEPLLAEVDFREDLERCIGEQHVDVLLIGPDEVHRPIDRIAIATGILLDDRAAATDPLRPSPLDWTPKPMTIPQEQLAAIKETVEAGRMVRSGLLESAAFVGSRLPITADILACFDRTERVESDAMLLRFSNLVAIVQDQLIRAILIAETERVEGRSRLDHRNTALKIGALPADMDFRIVTEVRNRIAHQYPNRHAHQAEILNAVLGAIPILIAAFDGLAAYAERRYELGNAPGA